MNHLLTNQNQSESNSAAILIEPMSEMIVRSPRDNPIWKHVCVFSFLLIFCGFFPPFFALANNQKVLRKAFAQEALESSLKTAQTLSSLKPLQRTDVTASLSFPSLNPIPALGQSLSLFPSVDPSLSLWSDCVTRIPQSLASAFFMLVGK